MSVTITRAKAIELGEQAVQRWLRGADRSENDPQVVGLRKVVAVASSFARGAVVADEDGRVVTCPMSQAGLWPISEPNTDGPTFSMAMAWDDVTTEVGFFSNVIDVNPLT